MMTTDHFKRDFLIAKVVSGELTPSEAEAEAVRLGLTPIELRPNPQDFDPMQEPFWTLPMAVAWIAYRTPNAVREAWDAYRINFTRWRYSDERRGPDLSGFDLFGGYPPACLSSLHLDREHHDRKDPDEYVLAVPDAIAALWEAMRRGCFSASGIGIETGKREELDALRLQDLTLAVLDHHDVLHKKLPIGVGPVLYREITVPKGEVCAHWGLRPPQPERTTLPPLVSLNDGGYMPLYCAAQWIATEGGIIDFDGKDVDRWRSAYAQLLARIASEDVKVIGFRDGRNEPLSGYRFAGIKVSYPFVDTPFDLILSDEMYLQSYCFTDEESWLEGLCDSLEQYRGEKWTRLMVQKSDVSTTWPYTNDATADNPDLSLVRSGAPGRPSAMHLVQAEFRRRCETGQVKSSLAREAEVLADWLKSTHPMLCPATPRTIENGIRAAFRAHKNPRN